VELFLEIFDRLKNLKLGKVYHTKLNYFKVVTFEKSSQEAYRISGETETIAEDYTDNSVGDDIENKSNPLSAVKAGVIGVLVDEKIEPVAILQPAGRGRPRTVRENHPGTQKLLAEKV